MTLRAYRLAPFNEIAPGDVVEYDGQIIVIDEVHRTLEGWRFVGWPLARSGKGRRVSVLADDTGPDVKVALSLDETEDLFAELESQLNMDGTVYLGETGARLELDPGAPGV